MEIFMTTFKLHSQLEQDSLWIADLQLSQLRLFNRQELLWLILIPQVSNCTELYELTTQQQAQLLEEINLLSRLLKMHFSGEKLNIATLGNQVPQLHIHVISRRKDDPFWPQAPFGLTTQTYTPNTALIEKIRTLL
jgi:diadenosine tetraphosphate (Ap4A) HIT family hydrolase